MAQEKVYVLIMTWHMDSGECGHDVLGVYEDVEKAIHDMKIEMKNARCDFSDLDTEETNYVDGDMSWSIWEEGEYCYNHCDISIFEREVE